MQQSGTMRSDKTLARIGALLVRAEGTNNPHEADACLSRAQTLATLNSIDLSVARMSVQPRTPASRPQQKTITIASVHGRGLRTLVDLFLVVARANNVKVDLARNYTEVYAFGYPEDLATTELLYNHVVTQMISACQAYLDTGDYKHELVQRSPGPGAPPTLRPLSKQSARLEFHAAFTARVKTRLAQARAAAAAAVPPSESGGGGQIVLAGKALAVQDYYTQHSIARGRRYRGHQPTTRSVRSRAAGDAAGSAVKLQAPGELAGAGAALEAGSL
ncbi:DUF2786 domain-containing protein [Mycobacterium kansasii]